MAFIAGSLLKKYDKREFKKILLHKKVPRLIVLSTVLLFSSIIWMNNNGDHRIPPYKYYWSIIECIYVEQRPHNLIILQRGKINPMAWPGITYVYTSAVSTYLMKGKCGFRVHQLIRSLQHTSWWTLKVIAEYTWQPNYTPGLLWVNSSDTLNGRSPLQDKKTDGWTDGERDEVNTNPGS